MGAQPTRPKRPGPLRRLLIAAARVFGVIGLILLSGMTLQACVERAERERFPPPGQLVDIGGGQLIHVRQWGEANPGPVLLLDGSAAMPSSIWGWVGPGLADLGHHVVAYDRPGMAWSSGPRQPRDARHAADAFSAALRAAAIPPPYVVVAHSYGAFSSRVFTGLRRDEVEALVLLDTTHPDAGGPVVAIPYRLQALLGHSGLFQIVAPPNGFSGLPAADAAAAGSVTKWTTHLDTTAEELEFWYDSANQVRQFPDFGDLPLLVVADWSSGLHLDLQRDLLELSTSSRFVQLEAEHMGMLLREQEAQMLIPVIDEFIRSLSLASVENRETRSLY